MTTFARQLHTQQTHYLRARVRFNSAGIATGIVMGQLPIGALIRSVTIAIETAFNAATTNVLTVGLSSETTTFDDLVAAASVNEGAVGITTVNNAAVQPLASVQNVVVQYTQTGTAATAGVATILVEYAPDNDLGTL